VKVEKAQRVMQQQAMVRGQPSRLVELETWDGWLKITSSTHGIIVKQKI